MPVSVALLRRERAEGSIGAGASDGGQLSLKCLRAGVSSLFGPVGACLQANCSRASPLPQARSHPLWLILALCLTACTPTAGLTEEPSAQVCASPLLAVDAAFDGGNFHRCEFLSTDAVLIEIHPEDAPPINPSAWYAFRVTPAQSNTALAITLQVQDGPARYWPWVSADGEDWTRLPESQVQRGP